MAWIKEQGLEAEVFKIQEPTVLSRGLQDSRTDSFQYVVHHLYPQGRGVSEKCRWRVECWTKSRAFRGVRRPVSLNRCLSESRI